MSVSLFSALAATDLLGTGQLITNIPLETLAILSNYDSLSNVRTSSNNNNRRPPATAPPRPPQPAVPAAAAAAPPPPQQPPPPNARVGGWGWAWLGWGAGGWGGWVGPGGAGAGPGAGAEAGAGAVDFFGFTVFGCARLVAEHNLSTSRAQFEHQPSTI